jgi:hypothetical protein
MPNDDRENKEKKHAAIQKYENKLYVPKCCGHKHK